MITNRLFIFILRGIASTQPGRNSNYKYILDKFIEEKHAKTTRQMVLSYYLALYIMILNDNFQEYDRVIQAFESFLKNHKNEQIKETLTSFQVESLIIIIEEHIRHYQEGNDDMFDIKSKKLKRVWQLIPPQK